MVAAPITESKTVVPSAILLGPKVTPLIPSYPLSVASVKFPEPTGVSTETLSI